jgi:hypothetical protein
VFKRSQTNESLLNVRIFEKQLIKQKMRGEKESQKSVLDRIFERIKIERKEDRESRSRENKAKS